MGKFGRQMQRRQKRKHKPAVGSTVPGHVQVVVEPTDEDRFPVDEGIAPLVLALWKRGYRTTGSCEEQVPGRAWIGFESEEEAERFAEVAGVHGEFMELDPSDLKNADPTDPALHGAVGISFPSAKIAELVAAVDAAPEIEARRHDYYNRRVIGSALRDRLGAEKAIIVDGYAYWMLPGEDQYTCAEITGEARKALDAGEPIEVGQEIMLTPPTRAG